MKNYQELKKGETMPFILAQSSDQSFDSIVTATFKHKETCEITKRDFRKCDFDTHMKFLKYSDQRLVSWCYLHMNNSEKEGQHNEA